MYRHRDGRDLTRHAGRNLGFTTSFVSNEIEDDPSEILESGNSLNDIPVSLVELDGGFLDVDDIPMTTEENFETETSGTSERSTEDNTIVEIQVSRVEAEETRDETTSEQDNF